MAFAGLLNSPSLAISAVLEQHEKGRLVSFGSGESLGTESTIVNASNEQLYGLHPTDNSNSAVVFDDPEKSDIPSPAGFALRTPRAMGLSLSGEQRQMQRMAAEVAMAYSRHPGVMQAQLDQAAFVTLFVAMIRRESNFNPRAISPAGAKGLGQLMPETARALGVCDIFSPRENLEGAAAYLTSMLEQFGSSAMALAAYNAGPTAVARYRRIPPYAETQQYVADIIYAAARTPRGSLPGTSIDDAYGSRRTAYLDETADHSGPPSKCMQTRAAGTVFARD